MTTGTYFVKTTETKSLDEKAAPGEVGRKLKPKKIVIEPKECIECKHFDTDCKVWPCSSCIHLRSLFDNFDPHLQMEADE